MIYEFNLTEGHDASTLIYLWNQLEYKTKNDLNIYTSFQLKSTFVEICNFNKTNVIIDCIYKHPNSNIN